MTRRTLAGLVALVLAAVLGFAALLTPVEYTRFRPGPTLDVLHEFDGQEIIQVSGRKTYPETGELRMVTVIPDGIDDRLDLLTAMIGWFDRDTALLPKDVVYKKNESTSSVRKESAAQMTGSQDAATAAALTAADIDFKTEARFTIGTVDAKGPSAGKLEPGDQLTAVDGKSASTQTALIEMIRKLAPGSEVTFDLLRDGKRRTATVTTVAAPDDAKQSRVGVAFDPKQPPVLKLVLPFQVDFKLSENIGGPSAGMIFALSLYDLLTPGSLTNGKNVAGSGEITPDGVVGPIGGIGQKLVGAQNDGVTTFLVAEENCAEALRSHYDRDKLKLVRIHTLDDAINALDKLRVDPDADVPTCRRG